MKIAGHFALAASRMLCREERILMEITWSCLSIEAKDGEV